MVSHRLVGHIKILSLPSPFRKNASNRVEAFTQAKANQTMSMDTPLPCFADDEEEEATNEHETTKNATTEALAGIERQRRPSLSRSHHERHRKSNLDDNADDNDLFVLTAYDIAKDLQEIPVPQVLQTYQQQQEEKSRHVENQDDAAAVGESPPRDSFWIHVQVTSQLDKALPVLDDKLWQPLRLSNFLQRHLRDATQWQTPQVVPLHDAVWIVMRILQSANPNSGAVRHAAAICLPHILVTLTVSSQSSNRRGSDNKTKPSLSPKGTHKATSLWQGTQFRHYHRDESLSRILQERELPEKSVSGCVVLWLGYHIGRTAALAGALRHGVYQTVETLSTLDAGTATNTTTNSTTILTMHADIRATKDTLLRVGAVAEEQNEGMQALVQGHAVSAGLTLDSSLALQGACRVVGQAAASTERMLTRLEKRVADLEHAVDAAQQDTINKRLQALTILSAVFLPLTLMAGVWGMNFANMPELQRPHAYHAALASMATVALCLLLFFYRNGWLS